MFIKYASLALGAIVVLPLSAAPAEDSAVKPIVTAMQEQEGERLVAIESAEYCCPQPAEDSAVKPIVAAMRRHASHGEPVILAVYETVEYEPYVNSDSAVKPIVSAMRRHRQH